MGACMQCAVSSLSCSLTSSHSRVCLSTPNLLPHPIVVELPHDVRLHLAPVDVDVARALQRQCGACRLSRLGRLSRVCTACGGYAWRDGAEVVRSGPCKGCRAPAGR